MVCSPLAFFFVENTSQPAICPTISTSFIFERVSGAIRIDHFGMPTARSSAIRRATPG